MKFIGHLDTMRYFQKAIRRSGIKPAFSQGFSPHMIMSFAEPLGVSYQSYGEYFDLDVDYDEDMPSSTEMAKMLNDVMVPGFSIVEIRRIGEDKKSKAMTMVAAASYLIYGKDPDDELCGIGNIWNISSEKLSELLDGFLSQNEIKALYRSKKGEKEVDIKERIIEASVNEDGAIDLFCLAGSTGNLRPTLFTETLCDFSKIAYDPLDYQIIRKEMYSSGEDGGFIPLIESGEAF